MPDRGTTESSAVTDASDVEQASGRLEQRPRHRHCPGCSRLLVPMPILPTAVCGCATATATATATAVDGVLSFTARRLHGLGYR
mgnify:CR=1 FL=1